MPSLHTHDDVMLYNDVKKKKKMMMLYDDVNHSPPPLVWQAWIT